MKTFNYLICLVVFLCAVSFTPGCSSSSSDDVADTGGENLSLLLPTTLAYTVSEPWYPDEYPNNDLLSASNEGVSISLIEHPDTTVEIPMFGTHMEGRYNTDTEVTTMFGNSFMWLDSGDLYGIMGLSIPSGVTVEWEGTDDPTSGSFFIDYRGDEMGYIGILIEVAQDADDELDGDQPGVNLFIYDGINPDAQYMDSFTWDEFEDLEEDEEAYQKIAAFCYGVWETVFERVGNCFNTTALFIEYSDALYSQGGNATIPVGDTFPPETGTTGTAACSWDDSSADDEMGPGDDFSLELTNLWEDDKDDDIDEMYNGTLHLYSLMLNADDARGVITSIGGDFVFENFAIQETVDNILDPGSIVTFNGGFNLSAHEY